MSQFNNYFDKINKQLDEMLEHNSSDSDYVTFNYKVDIESDDYPNSFTVKLTDDPKAKDNFADDPDEDKDNDIHEDIDDEEDNDDYECDWDDCCEECLKDIDDDDDYEETLDIDTGIDILCKVTKDGDVSMKVVSIPDAASVKMLLPDIAHAFGDIILATKPRIVKDL